MRTEHVVKAAGCWCGRYHARRVPATPSVRLLERLRALGVDLAPDVEIRRNYAGHHQRSAGAWTWYVAETPGRRGIGSQYPVTELLKGRIMVTRQFRDYDYHVDPADNDPRNGHYAECLIEDA